MNQYYMNISKKSIYYGFVLFNDTINTNRGPWLPLR